MNFGVIKSHPNTEYLHYRFASGDFEGNFCIMGRKKAKASSTPATTISEHVEDGGLVEGAVATSQTARITALESKLDRVVDLVEGLGERLQRQEDVSSISPVPSAHSSPHHKRARVPSFEELRSDSHIQADVQKQLHTYDNVSRLDVKGRSTDVYKSGRFRAGIHKVRHVIPWPQDYCTTVSGYKQPTYDDLNVFQWSQGFVYCVLEESHRKTRENMLRYFTSLMQDAVEMSFATAKRAHSIILQEIEKRNSDWDNLDKIEKLRCRHTEKYIYGCQEKC